MSDRPNRKAKQAADAESAGRPSSDSTEDFNPRADSTPSPEVKHKHSSGRKSDRKSGNGSKSDDDQKGDSVAVELQPHARRSRRKRDEPEITTAAQEESEESEENARPAADAASRRSTAGEANTKNSNSHSYEEEEEPRSTKEKIVWSLRYCCWGVFETLSCSYLNVFLALAPFVYLSLAFSWPQEAVFLLDILAIMSHSAMMVRLRLAFVGIFSYGSYLCNLFLLISNVEFSQKFAWEMVVKEWKHPAVEKFVHLVFRNGPVLVLGIFGPSGRGSPPFVFADVGNDAALIRNSPRLAQGIIFGVILNRLTVVLGLAFLFGWKEEKRKIEGKSIKIASTFVLVVLFAILTPSFFGASTSAQSGDEGLTRMSRWVAILLALACIIYSLFNVKTHPKFHEKVDVRIPASLRDCHPF